MNFFLTNEMLAAKSFLHLECSDPAKPREREPCHVCIFLLVIAIKIDKKLNQSLSKLCFIYFSAPQIRP